MSPSLLHRNVPFTSRPYSHDINASNILHRILIITIFSKYRRKSNVSTISITKFLTTIIEPVTNFLTRRKIIVNGKQVSVSAALALEVAEQAAETLLRVDLPEGPLLVERDGEVDEESGLLSHSDGDATKMDSTMRRGSHCGHHHYDPPPIDGSDYPGVSDATRKSQLLAVGLWKGDYVFTPFL